MFNDTQWKIICIKIIQQKGMLIFNYFFAASSSQENEKFERFRLKDFPQNPETNLR